MYVGQVKDIAPQFSTYLDSGIIMKENVIRLEITMNDILCMKIIHALSSLSSDVY